MLLACGHSKLAGRRLGELQELHDAVHCLGRQSRQVLGLAHFMALEHVRGEGFCDLGGRVIKRQPKKMREKKKGRENENEKEREKKEKEKKVQDREKEEMKKERERERETSVCERKMNKTI